MLTHFIALFLADASMANCVGKCVCGGRKMNKCLLGTFNRNPSKTVTKCMMHIFEKPLVTPLQTLMSLVDFEGVALFDILHSRYEALSSFMEINKQPAKQDNWIYLGDMHIGSHPRFVKR